MKKMICIFIAVIVLPLMWLACGRRNAAPNISKDRLYIVASGYAVYALAREIAGDQVELSILVRPGTEPHDFEPSPGDIIAVDRADLFFYVSAQMEPWVSDILKGLGSANAVATGLVEPEQDPHVWMTPHGALAMAKRMAAALEKADSARKAVYRSNLARFTKEMEQLHSDFMKGLAHCQNRYVVHVGHLAFGSLADAYGLKLEALSGTSHQQEHSVRRLAGLVRFIRKQGLPVVFSEELSASDLARTVAQETGVKVLPLYTVEEVTKQDFEQGKTYEQYMRQNLQNLQEGLKCQAL